MCEREKRTFEREIIFRERSLSPQSSASVSGKRWSEVSGLDGKKKGSGSRRRGRKFNIGGGVGEENINRACGVEAACHDPL